MHEQQASSNTSPDGVDRPGQGSMMGAPKQLQPPFQPSEYNAHRRGEASHGEAADHGREDVNMALDPSTPRRGGDSSRGDPASHFRMPPTLNTPRMLSMKTPLSPQLDASSIYASSGSVLPRHSRGLDFSRAATNLHHSTLADASPDTSPVVSARSMAIPRRRSNGGSMSGSPPGFGDRGAPSGVLRPMSSVNMLDADSSEDDDEDEDEDEEEVEEQYQDADRGGDKMELATPRPNDPTATPSTGQAFYSPFATDTPGGLNVTPISGTRASFKNYQRNRLRHPRPRHLYHGHAPYNVTKTSVPGASFPGILRSVESVGEGQYLPGMNPDEVRGGHRGSGSDMQFSDASDDEMRQGRNRSPSSIAANSKPEPGRPGVVRRAITRPRNLMPKPKPFNRIRAQLLEETAPLDFDVKREAEVIRQVRESEPDPQPTTFRQSQSESEERSQPPPSLFSSSADPGEGIPPTTTSNIFKQSPRYETPPPPSRHSSDVCMETPPPLSAVSTSTSIFASSAAHTTGGTSSISAAGPSSSSTSNPVPIPANASKRRRDEFMEFSTFKRRAVSPSVSVISGQSSPKVTPYPRPASISSESGGPSSGSGGVNIPVSATSTGTPAGSWKRVGLQGMKETNEGLMNMKLDPA